MLMLMMSTYSRTKELSTSERRRVPGLDVAAVPAALAPDDALHADGEVEARLRPGQAHGRAWGWQAAHGEDHHKGQAA